MIEVINIGKKKVKIESKKCNFFDMIFGLMFQRREKAIALSFDLKEPMAIHSWFVFFPFVGVWLNKGKVVEIQKIEPFRLHIKPKKYFDKLIEIPVNKKYQSVLRKLYK